MQNQELISADEFCIHHQIEISFVRSLHEHGLIEASIVETKLFVPASELGRLEKYTRLHYDLEINLEGLQTISHLLEKLKDMQGQVMQLNNRLGLYE